MRIPLWDIFTEFYAINIKCTYMVGKNIIFLAYLCILHTFMCIYQESY